ncbi:MAG: glycosyltransferase family 39 protein [Bacteroidia bacterium]|nr:glycosyltransferase family 39 protein [Bacteroidia bacterium]NNC85886.1 hypothetical protein [Bacteroidia bacterium]
MKFSWVAIIVAIGFIVRLLFLFFGAEIYHGKPDFYISGDTHWWVRHFTNLVEFGIYSGNLENELGYFGRTPGYSFFIGFFYLITGKNVDLALQLIPYAQLITDTISIWFVYKITEYTFKDKLTSIVASTLYAFYPFIIVWNVVAHAESFSVFLLFFAIYLFVKAKTNWNFFFVGVMLSLAVLTRIQLILAIPVFGLVILCQTYNTTKKLFNPKVLLFVLAVVIVYGSWPIRNYVNHDRVLFSQHLGDEGPWAPDYMKYMEYIWSVKVDHNPQMTQIISNADVVEFPNASYVHAPDSVLLNRVVSMARTCGVGFSYFARSSHYRKDVVQMGEDCNDEMVEIFDELIMHQKMYNPLNYYLWVPFGNLKKAIFKSKLYSPSSKMVDILSRLLFTYRTALILLGIFGLLFLFMKHRELFYSRAILIGILYVVTWYLFNAFVYRNMEIRFLLHADILLLLPGSFLLAKLISRTGLVKLKE